MQPYCTSLHSQYYEAVQRNALMAKHNSNKRAGSNRFNVNANQMIPKGLSSYIDSVSGASTLEKMSAVESLLKSYMREHGSLTLEPQSSSLENSRTDLVWDQHLCRSQRSFLVGVYSCPQQVGNRLHEFLNAYAAAVITNRTLIWKFCDRSSCSNKASECAPFLRLAGIGPLASQPWVLSAERVLARLHNGGCQFPAYEYSDIPSSDSAYKKHANGVTGHAFLNGVTAEQVVPHALYSSAGEAVAACCGIDTLAKERILDLGSLERREMFGLVFPGANLGPKAAERASLLFSGGANYGYGMLLRTAFEFTPEVLDWNRKIKKTMGVDSEASLDNVLKRRRLSKSPQPDDDAPQPTAKKSDKRVNDRFFKNRGNDVKGGPQTQIKKSGRQVLPSGALALPSNGKTTVKSPQGTSVGPQAGGQAVLIAVAGGSEATDLALRSGAAPSNEFKSASSPEVMPLVQRKPSQGKVPTRAGQKRVDFWSQPNAGNLTAQVTRDIKPKKGAQNGIGVPVERDTQNVVHTHALNAARLPATAKRADALLSKLYGKDRTSLKVEAPFKQELNVSTPNATFILALHLRHANRDDTGEVDKRGEMDCVRAMLSLHVPSFAQWQMTAHLIKSLSLRIEALDRQTTSQQISVQLQYKQDNLERMQKERSDLQRSLPRLGCAVLIASDRAATIKRIEKEVRDIGCDAWYAPRANRKPAEMSGTVNNEHGPFRDGIEPIADLELLSHADAFIGSSEDQHMHSIRSNRVPHLSTYSLLVASLVSTNARQRRRMSDTNNQKNIITDEDAFVRWLPHCVAGFSSYLPPSTPVVEPMLSANASLWDSFKRSAAVQKSDGGFTSAVGNGHYEATDCPFFTWNKACTNTNLMRASRVCPG